MKNNHLVIVMFSLFFYLPALQAQTFYVTDKVLVGVYELATTESNLIKALPTGTPIEVLERDGEYAKIRSPDGTTGWVENSYLIDHKPAQLVVLDLTDQQKQTSEQLSLAQAELEATQKQLVDAKSKTSDNSEQQTKKLKTEITKLENNSSKLKKELSAIKKQLKNKTQQHTATVDQNKQLQETIIELRKKKKPDPTTATAKTVDKKSSPASTENNEQLATLTKKNQQLTTTLNQIRDALQLPATTTTNEAEGINLKIIWILIGSLIFIVSGFIAGIKWLDWRNLKRHGGFRI